MAIDVEGLIEEMERIQRERIKNKLKSVGKEAEIEMKKIKNNIIDEWFGEYNSLSMKIAMVVDKHKISTTKNSEGLLKLKLRVDPNRYNEKVKLHEWLSKYGGSNGNAEMWVLENQLDRGILALPKKATYRHDSDWVNPHFDEQNSGRKPLWEYLTNDSRWNDFMNNVKSKIES